jgi:hypothetical protein
MAQIVNVLTACGITFMCLFRRPIAAHVKTNQTASDPARRQASSPAGSQGEQKRQNIMLMDTTLLNSRYDNLKYMPYRDPDAKRDYDREWRRRQRAKKKATEEGQK